MVVDMKADNTPERRFAQLVKTAREQRGWSQSTLADAMSSHGVDTHYVTVAKIEKNSRGIRLDEAAALSQILGLNLSDALAPRGDEDDTLREIRTVASIARTAIFGLSRQASESMDRAANLPEGLVYTPDEVASHTADPLRVRATVTYTGVYALVHAARALTEVAYAIDSLVEKSGELAPADVAYFTGRLFELGAILRSFTEGGSNG